jgi:hypothetical protein
VVGRNDKIVLAPITGFDVDVGFTVDGTEVGRNVGLSDRCCVGNLVLYRVGKEEDGMGVGLLVGPVCTVTGV